MAGNFNWIVYALTAAVLFGSSSIISRYASIKINAINATLIEALGTLFVAVLVFLIYHRHEIGSADKFERWGLMFAAGVIIGVAIIFAFQTFVAGAPLGHSAVVIRVGTFLVAAAGGIIFFREQLSWQFAIGFTLAATGVYLVATSPK